MSLDDFVPTLKLFIELKGRHLKNNFKAGKMAQQIKPLADKPGSSSSVPGTQEVEGENWPL